MTAKMKTDAAVQLILAQAAPEPGAPPPRTTVYAQIPGTITMAYTTVEFAKAYGLSVPTVKALLRTGKGPDVIKLGDGKRPHLLITVEAAQRWTRERTRPYEPSKSDWYVNPNAQRGRRKKAA